MADTRTAAEPTTMSGPVPRWAVRAAWAVPLCVLPSALARLGLVFNLYGDDAPPIGPSLAERIYVPSLSVVSMGLALLTLGLVQSWGEVLPRWVPWLGGRRIPIRLAVVPAMTGAALLILACLYAVLNAKFHFVTHVKPLIGEEEGGTELRGRAEAILIAAYLPLLAWGPLLAAVAVAYHRRRTRAERSPVAAPALRG